VEVFDRGNPVVGLQIELSTDPRSGKGRTVRIVKTDANGLVAFAKIRNGLYYVGIRHPAYAYSEEIQVVRHPPNNSPKKITFEWPGWKPLSTQTVSGVVTGRARTDRGLALDLAKAAYGQVSGAKLTLSKAVSNELVDSRTTEGSGKYDFGDVPPGLYFLRVEKRAGGGAHLFPSDGYVPVEVDSSAKFQDLNLVLDNAICGELAWSRREEMSQ